jgi:D-serine dehydratase
MSNSAAATANAGVSSYVQEILNLELDSTTKSIPLVNRKVRLGEVGQQGWNVQNGDMMYPVLVLRDDYLKRNLLTIRDYANRHNMSLAPHGKSTVCPQLYLDQIGFGGCWGITSATIQQASVAAATGVKNIIIANEVVGPANVKQYAALKHQYPDVAFYSVVDSKETVDQLVRFGKAHLKGARFQVMIELGYVGGRCGARTEATADAVVDAVLAASDVLELVGIECYEGTINLSGHKETIEKVDQFLDFVCAYFRKCESSGKFGTRTEVILTAGGSSYYDRVVEKFATARTKRTRVVLRGGSYLTYDHGFYRKKLNDLVQRGALSGPQSKFSPKDDFAPALEIWAMVQAIHESGVAVLTMGIRDLPYDLGYPTPVRQYRDGKLVDRILPEAYDDMSKSEGQFVITSSNDQHCYMSFPAGADLKVGDVIACGISHPCTAFDKWDVLYRVDKNFNVIGALKTCF